MGLASVYRHIIWYNAVFVLAVVAATSFLSRHSGELKPCNSEGCVYHHTRINTFFYTVLPPLGRRLYQPYANNVGGWVAIQNGAGVDYQPWVDKDGQETQQFSENLAGGLTRGWNVSNVTAVKRIQQACSEPAMQKRIIRNDRVTDVTLVYIFLVFQVVLNILHDVLLLHGYSYRGASISGIASSTVTILLAWATVHLCSASSSVFVAVDWDIHLACFYSLPGHSALLLIAATLAVWKASLSWLPQLLRALTYGGYYYFRSDTATTYMIKGGINEGLMKDESDLLATAPHSKLLWDELSRTSPSQSTFLEFIPQWSLQPPPFNLDVTEDFSWRLLPFVVAVFYFESLVPIWLLCQEVVIEWPHHFSKLLQADAETMMLIDLLTSLLRVVLHFVLALSCGLAAAMTAWRRLTFEARVHCYLIFGDLWLIRNVALECKHLVMRAMTDVLKTFGGHIRMTAHGGRHCALLCQVYYCILVLFSLWLKCRQYRIFLGHFTHAKVGPPRRSCYMHTDDEISETSEEEELHCNQR